MHSVSKQIFYFILIVFKYNFQNKTIASHTFYEVIIIIIVINHNDSLHEVDTYTYG